jgi:hypothetical protein
MERLKEHREKLEARLRAEEEHVRKLQSKLLHQHGNLTNQPRREIDISRRAQNQARSRSAGYSRTEHREKCTGGDNIGVPHVRGRGGQRSSSAKVRSGKHGSQHKDWEQREQKQARAQGKNTDENNILGQDGGVPRMVQVAASSSIQRAWRHHMYFGHHSLDTTHHHQSNEAVDIKQKRRQEGSMAVDQAQRGDVNGTRPASRAVQQSETMASANSTTSSEPCTKNVHTIHEEDEQELWQEQQAQRSEPSSAHLPGLATLEQQSEPSTSFRFGASTSSLNRSSGGLNGSGSVSGSVSNRINADQGHTTTQPDTSNNSAERLRQRVEQHRLGPSSPGHTQADESNTIEQQDEVAVVQTASVEIGDDDQLVEPVGVLPAKESYIDAACARYPYQYVSATSFFTLHLVANYVSCTTHLDAIL